MSCPDCEAAHTRVSELEAENNRLRHRNDIMRRALEDLPGQAGQVRRVHESELWLEWANPDE